MSGRIRDRLSGKILRRREAIHSVLENTNFDRASLKSVIVDPKEFALKEAK